MATDIYLSTVQGGPKPLPSQIRCVHGE